MITSVLSYDVAYEMASGEKWSLERFFKGGDNNDYMIFSHYNFIYHYPEWGKKFKGVDYSFHQIELQCNICKKKPDRNYAGVGIIYLLHNGASHPETIIGERILDGKKIKINYKTVPNEPPYRSLMICHCRNCIKGYFPFDRYYQGEINKKEMTSDKASFERIKKMLNQ